MVEVALPEGGQGCNIGLRVDIDEKEAAKYPIHLPTGGLWLRPNRFLGSPPVLGGLPRNRVPPRPALRPRPPLGGVGWKTRRSLVVGFLPSHGRQPGTGSLSGVTWRFLRSRRQTGKLGKTRQTACHAMLSPCSLRHVEPLCHTCLFTIGFQIWERSRRDFFGNIPGCRKSPTRQ